ncbi:MAG TPA: hypothetical protein VGH31_00365 [Acidimicrobiales bacterium]
MRRTSVVVLSAGLLVLTFSWSSAGGAQTTSSGVSVLPVVTCPTTYGAGGRTGVYVPTMLPAITALHGLSFYSNGLNTALAPAGWHCHALVAADGGQVLDVSPPGSPDYSTSEPPKGAKLVQVATDYTGHLPGGELVCALFPHSAAAAAISSSGLKCPTVSSRERVVHLTKDITTFVDPVRVVGVGTGSGGALPSRGAGVYPQVTPTPQSVDVALLSCTLPAREADLCRAIQSDFLIRYTPVDEGTATNG